MSSDSKDIMEQAYAAQERAARLFERGDERGARVRYRDACSLFRVAMAEIVPAEGMRRYLLALQGLTVAAAVRGGIDEARFAAGTGGANAAVARERWSAPVFEEMVHRFDDLAAKLGGNCPQSRRGHCPRRDDLAAKLGGNCPVFVSDDPASWPFDD